ncbi:MAG: DNA replication/repair protein RecF [Lachnospiraceae bacterium]|nr:DNA replication/repair protein RecF [Lachnospiraceae bacterium]
MIVKKLELSNFRNYDNLEIDFDKSINILYGNNAQGKTNILEAVYMSGTAKSHRSNKDAEIIRFGSAEAHIKLFIEKNEREYRIDMHLKNGRSKGIAINGIPIRKASELFGVFNVIFFSPEDLSIIKNGPVERRRFIDLELCQLDKIYVYNLTNYSKVLAQRNKLLKDIGFRKDLTDTLDIWDMQLAEYGKNIIRRRYDFINQMNEIVRPIHSKLSNNLEELKIIYNPNVEIENFEQTLINNRERDIITKTTNSGPHRDDIRFFDGDIDLKKFGSQGQQRTVALSLKLAEIELVKKIIKDSPVLLLDDVMSELDDKRQNHLLDSIKDIQTIITCTGLDEFIESRLHLNKVYEVSNGTVSLKEVE